VYTYNMTTVDNLLIKTINFTSPSVDECISAKDARILKSLATAANSRFFITEKQGLLLLKILRENFKKIPFFDNEAEHLLTTPVWSRPFRFVEQIKKFYISKFFDDTPSLVIEFTFNSNLRKTILQLSGKVDNLTQHTPGHKFIADLTEKNIIALVDELTPLHFEIDETIKTHYKTIKSWSEQEVRDQFLITAMTNQNFHRCITNDLGIDTPIDNLIIKDRSHRYQYFTENSENFSENLVDYIANRSSTRVWIDKNQHNLDEVVKSLIRLKRLPVMIIFENAEEAKSLKNLEILGEILEKNNIDKKVGIYFRLENNEHGKKFNQYIAEKQFNKHLDFTTEVVCVQSGKIPKFFMKTDWRPMSVIVIDAKMGFRHGKTGVYANCCDLIIEYCDQPSLSEERLLIK